MSAHAHFKIAGIPVRVEPVFLIIAGLFGLRFVEQGLYRVGPGLLRGGLDVVAMWIVAAFISILVHELGHGLTLKVFGQPSAIVLHGFGGVTISPRRGQTSKVRSILVSLAGSLTALVVLWLPTRQALGSEWILDQPRLLIWLIYFLAFQNLWWSIANLLPIRPLDGGNVTAELFGLPAARRISIGVAIAGAIWAFANDQGYAAFFALFLAFNNWQEIRAEQSGHGADAFHVDAPDVGQGRQRRSRRGRAQLRSVPTQMSGPQGSPTLTPSDPARQEQMAWSALRSGDTAGARRIVERLGTGAGPYLRAAAALAAGDEQAFELFEAAYVERPGGPPNMVATDVLARSGAATAVAKRLVARPDGSGREGAGTLQTHLHYGDHFRAAAEVGEAVFAASPLSPAQTAFEVACSWARADDVDRSIEWLERAADHGFRAASIVGAEPDLAAVRADARWPLLQARLS